LIKPCLIAVAIRKPERHARSFTWWQQATIEITRCDHSIVAHSRATLKLLQSRMPDRHISAGKLKN